MQAKAQQSQPEVDKPATSVGDVIKAKKKKTRKPENNWTNCPKCNKAYVNKEALAKHVDDCDGKVKGGRKPGVISPEKQFLLDKKKAMQRAIAEHSNELLVIQLGMARGSSHLWRRYKVTKTVGKAKVEQWHVERVTEDADFMLYLSLEHDRQGAAKDKATGDEYYYLGGTDGNHMAIMNLFDRAFGKPKEQLEMTGEDDEPLPVAGTADTIHLAKRFLDYMLNETKASPKP